MLLRIFIIYFFLFLSLQAHGETRDRVLTLSLKEAIFLSIRENPNVLQAQLNHVQQKFALDVAKWQFQPHFLITGTANAVHSVANNCSSTSKNYGLQPTATLLTPIGTQFNLNAANNVTNHYNPGLSLQIFQPLLRGFGRPIVEASLYNAIDSEFISRLNVENALRTTVTAVINAYLNVVSAVNSVKIDEDAVKRAETSVHQTKLFIKAGRKAGVELVTVLGDAANAKTKLETDKNNLEQMRYSLLEAIGIDPNTKVQFTDVNVYELIAKYITPTLEETKRLAICNDIQYQIDKITISGTTKRSLQLAEDNARWQLDLTATVGTGNGGGNGKNSGLPSLINGYDTTEGLQLNLSIPIDDRNAKLAIVSAKIGLREAAMALKQEKWTKEINAINLWNTIYSAKRALTFAIDAEKLQRKTYQISFQKYTYGLIDSVELQGVQQQLVTRQQSLLDANITYLKALVNLDQQIGRTLCTWDIGVRYS